MLNLMTTNDSQAEPIPQPTPITGIQPGGGLGPRLAPLFGGREAVWRRNVADPATAHEGDILLTPHPLRLARAGLPELILFTLLLGSLTALLAGLALALHPLFWAPAAVVFGVLLFIISFFRDPERIIPSDPFAVVSPADGTVTDVGEVAEVDFPGGRAFRVGIFLSVFNVHVNRVPRTGRVLGVRYFPGKFCDARTVGCAKVNEQLWIDIGEGPPARLIRVKQIAGAIARRIVCWLRPGEEVQAGVRLGMIKFGSRTEICLPIEAVKEVLVKPGDKVKGGSTILLRVEE